MSDSSAAAGAETPTGVLYTISTQYVKDLSFENPRAPLVFVQSAGKAPQVQVSVEVVGQQLSDTLYEVVLHIRAEAQHEGDALFVAELDYAGVVLSNGTIPPEHLGPLVNIEVPRQLFPFARAILGNATRDGGFMPLLLAPVDFDALYRRKQVQAGAEAESATG